MYTKPVVKEQSSDLAKLCKKLGVECFAVLTRTPLDAKIIWSGGNQHLHVPSHKEWDDTAFHYTVTLKYKGKELVTEYKMGYGNSKLFTGIPNYARVQPIAPSAADVIYSLVMDSGACEQSFADWCCNYGYETDSRKALALYEQCQILGDKVRKFLGADFSKFQGVEH